MGTAGGCEALRRRRNSRPGRTADRDNSMSSCFRFTESSLAPDRTSVRLLYACAHKGERYAFTETVTFPVRLPESRAVDALLRFLHLAAGTSYYKLFVPERIEHGYALSRDEAAFWNTVYRHGLRECLYTNRIPEQRLAVFSEDGPAEESARGPAACGASALLGLGGGKDSVVAGELLKQLGRLGEAFVVTAGAVPAPVQDVADTMGVTLLAVRREIDGALSALARRPDACSGHVPVSALFAILGCLLAVARGHGCVAVGNEHSASIPHAVWEGREVNHQWSKSLRFERLFQQRLRALGAPVGYCSPIRPLNAVSVAALFATMDPYHRVFTSDGAMFRIDPRRRPAARWTVDSPKSLSSYILLLPWIDARALQSVFGRDLLDEAALQPMLEQLLGREAARPLDCVGTPEELRVSLEAALAQGKCAASRLARHAVAVQFVRRRDDALARLQDALTAAGEHAFPPDVAADLLRAIGDRLDACRQTPRRRAGAGKDPA
jgi:UDP-N-acetyl-alpha-D-muramoyl-L-alanyl-L-glutamate epimerase